MNGVDRLVIESDFKCLLFLIFFVNILLECVLSRIFKLQISISTFLASKSLNKDLNVTLSFRLIKQTLCSSLFIFVDW